MEKVPVPRVVSGEEETEDPTRVAGRSGDEVGDGRGRCVGGDLGGGGEESRVGSDAVGSGVGRGGVEGGGEREEEAEREEGCGEDYVKSESWLLLRHSVCSVLHFVFSSHGGAFA